MLALVAAATASPAHAAVSLAAHHADYDLALSVSPGGQTVAATGQMSFEVRDRCDAWSTRQTLTVDATDRDGTQTSTRSDYATFETKDGRSLQFSVVERSGGGVADTVRGVATRAAPAAPVVARFSVPAGLTRTLPPGTLFPMAHNAAIVAAADAGRRALSPVLFDGTSSDGAQDTAVTILSWVQTGEAAAPAPALAGLSSGRVHIAFYPAGGRGMLPEYEIGMRYFADGVSDRLDMDFGAFSMHGDLRSLHLLPAAAACPK